MQAHKPGCIPPTHRSEFCSTPPVSMGNCCACIGQGQVGFVEQVGFSSISRGIFLFAWCPHSADHMCFCCCSVMQCGKVIMVISPGSRISNIFKYFPTLITPGQCSACSDTSQRCLWLSSTLLYAGHPIAIHEFECIVNNLGTTPGSCAMLQPQHFLTETTSVLLSCLQYHRVANPGINCLNPLCCE